MHRRSSIHIENILDDCVTAIYEQGKNVADCLARYPDRCEELEPLLRLTIRLQAAQALQAPPEFRRLSAIRVGNLVAVRQRQNERSMKRDPMGHVRRRWQAIFGVSRRLTATIVASIVLIASLLVSSGVVYASADDLPGDALYPVKRAAERTQLAISLDDANDAKLRLSFAIRRLDEVAALLEKGQPQDIGQALSDYDLQMKSIAAFLGEESTLSADEQIALANQLIAVQTHHEAQFAVLLGQAPQDTQSTIELALAASRVARGRALQVLGVQPLGVQPGKPPHPYEPPESTRTVTPQASPEPPTGTPSPTLAPTYPFTPSSPSRPSATPTAEPTRWPTPSPWLTPPNWTPSPWPTLPSTPDRTPTPPPPTWTPLPWPTLPPPPNRTPTPPSTLPPTWIPTPERTLTPPNWTPSPWPTLPPPPERTPPPPG